MGFLTKAQRAAREPRVAPLPPNRPERELTADPLRPRVYIDLAVGGAFAGRLCVELYADVAPRLAENFRVLCRGDLGARCRLLGSRFHRLEPGALLHGGDVERGDGAGFASVHARAPFAERARGWAAHEAGALTAAHAGDGRVGSQFALALSAQRHLDGRHVVFGRCLPESRALVARLAAGLATAGDAGAPAHEIVVRGCGELLAEWRAEGSGLIVGDTALALALERRWRSWRASAEPKVSFTLDEAEAGGGAPQKYTFRRVAGGGEKLALVQPRDERVTRTPHASTTGGAHCENGASNTRLRHHWVDFAPLAPPPRAPAGLPPPPRARDPRGSAAPPLAAGRRAVLALLANDLASLPRKVRTTRPRAPVSPLLSLSRFG